MANATKDLTPEQKLEDELLTVDEDALNAAGNAIIGASHPSNMAALRSGVENYLAQVKIKRDEARAAKGDKDYDPTLGRDQRQAAIDNKAKAEAAEKARKEWEEKNPEAAKKAREDRDREERYQVERDRIERERAGLGKHARDLGRNDRDTRRDEKK